MSSPLGGRRVFLTGGGGFLGRHLSSALTERGAALLAPSHRELDLLDREAVRAFLRRERPHVVIHAAAVVGGIGANSRHPGRFFFENAAMGIQLIEESRLAAVEKFVCIGTTCMYPKITALPFREDDVWNGYPEETNAAYGIAKRALLAQIAAYRQEYGFPGIFLIPANLYGPGDHFDLESGHVIPAMIRKFLEAAERGEAGVTLWGDGSPTREFLYVEDAAEGVALAAEHYDGDEPVNLGTGDEVSIFGLAVLIARLAGYDGAIRWDSSMPNGQPRRRLDTSRARERFGFTARTPLERGLEETIAWYRQSRGQVTT